MAQQECNNIKHYTSAFRYIYIYIYKSKIIRSINNNRNLPFYSSSQVMIITNTSHITLFLEKNSRTKASVSGLKRKINQGSSPSYPNIHSELLQTPSELMYRD